MSSLPAPGRTWVRFGPELPEGRRNPIRLDRYQIDKVMCVKGEPIRGIEPATVLERVEDAAPFSQSAGPLIGCTQHLLYTHQQERRELSAISAPESGPTAVLIPIRKSETWWALAQDEREQLF